jgi:hypothetical protein
LHLCFSNTKKFCKALVHALISLNCSKQTINEEDMRLGLEMGLQLFFQKNWSKLSFILITCFLCCSFTSDAQQTFVRYQFAHPMTQKLLNSTKELGKYWEMFDDRYMFGDGRFYPMWTGHNTPVNSKFTKPRRLRGVMPDCQGFRV